MKVLLLIVAFVFYIVGVNLSFSAGLLIIILFGTGCFVFWILPIFMPNNLLSSATTGRAMPENYIPLGLGLIGLFGWMVGLAVANKEWQDFLINLITP